MLVLKKRIKKNAFSLIPWLRYPYLKIKNLFEFAPDFWDYFIRNISFLQCLCEKVVILIFTSFSVRVYTKFGKVPTNALTSRHFDKTISLKI